MCKKSYNVNIIIVLLNILYNNINYGYHIILGNACNLLYLLDY
jgi:hypothetical protein